MKKLILVIIFTLFLIFECLARILEEIEKSEVFSEGLKEPNPNAVFVDFTPDIALQKLLTLINATDAEKLVASFSLFANLFIFLEFLILSIWPNFWILLARRDCLNYLKFLIFM